MDLRRIKYLSCMFEAYLEGKTVQIQYIDKWVDIKDVGDFKHIFNEFRIKPQHELVPFTFEDNLLFRDKWIRTKGLIALNRILWFGPSKISFGNLEYTCRNLEYTYKELLDNFEFEDGTPCGKYID